LANAAAHAIGYGMHRSRSHDAVIRVYDDAGNVIETHAPVELAGALCFEEKLANLQCFPVNFPLWRQK
jgi:hypothetical protein